MKSIAVRVLASLLLAAGLALISNGVRADDFRIETKIFVGKELQPSSETVTLFRGGKVYDFLTKPNEATIFDKPRGRVILLDPARKVRTEIKSDQLIAFSDELKLWAGKHTEASLKFAANPQFEQTLDPNGELVFTSPYVTYRVATTKANTEAVAEQYLDFSDSYARLNALTNPGSMPPFPRLAINAVLFKMQVIPEKVQVTILSRQLLGKATTLRSEHSVTWRLLESDLQRINEVDDNYAKFNSVPLQEYLRTNATADAKH